MRYQNPKVPKGSKWSKAVGEILKLSHEPEAGLAAELGLDRAIPHRWLRGERPITPQQVRNVNEAVADLAGLPEVADYLFALALEEGIIDPEGRDLDRALRAIDVVLRGLQDYLIVDRRRFIDEALVNTGFAEKKLFAFGFQLAGALGKSLYGRLDGRATRKPLAEEFLRMFQEAGLDVTPWLRSDEELAQWRMRDRFQLAVEAALAKHAPDITLRSHSAIVHMILLAYEDTAEGASLHPRSENAVRRPTQVPHKTTPKRKAHK
jgi:hypothetical protein